MMSDQYVARKKDPVIIDEMNGPDIYENWLKMEDGPHMTLEYPVYADAHIVGEGKYGPYEFLNCLALSIPGVVQSALVLRCEYHREYPEIDWSKSDAQSYTGGDLQDEIVALASLVLGVRLRVGDVSREFLPHYPPKGCPRSPRHRNPPVLNIKGPHQQWILPRAVTEKCSIQPPSLLNSVPELKASHAHSLVRAAQAYQDALWLSESDPELSWLLLVSALETAAIAWRAEKEDPLVRLETAQPELCRQFYDAGQDSLLRSTAEAFKDSLGATRKFLDFTLKFTPPPAEPRPSFRSVDWTPESLERLFRKVYDLRSRALHDGQPFPAPMCDPPYTNSAWLEGAFTEIPSAPVNINGRTWLEKDVPMLLHTFEHITRGALLKWWASIVPDQQLPSEN